LHVARGERDYKSMAQSHNEIMSYMKKATAQETQGLSGIGAFFRVGFWGGLPPELKGQEFVYRVPLMTQIGEFQRGILQLIYPLVSGTDR
jgi:Dock homology region 2